MAANPTPTPSGTALTLAEPLPAPAIMSQREITDLFEVARALAASGMFKDAFKAEQAFAKMLIGRDLGLSPTQAMMGIHIIEGKPELSANLQAAFVKRTPGYDYRVTEHTDEACEITFYRDGEELGVSRFTMQDAEVAGLAGRGPWKAYPKNMLYARAMSNGVAFHCPEVTGGVRTYSEGEIGGDENAPEIDSPAAIQPEPQTTGRPALTAAPPQPTEALANAGQRGKINGWAAEAGLAPTDLANIILAAGGSEPREFDSQDAAQAWLNRAMGRLPARLVDTILDAIKTAATEGDEPQDAEVVA